MKTIFRLGSLGLVLAAACLGRAEDLVVESRMTKVEGRAGTSESVAAKSPMHDQLALLLRADAGTFVVPVPAEEADEVVTTLPDDTLKLETMTVKGERIVIPPPRHESPAQQFLRTGTIWEKVGPRFTRRLWAKGDRGVMFTIAW